MTTRTAARSSLLHRPSAARRALRVGLPVMVPALAVSLGWLAGPAAADVPVGWSEPAPVSILDFLWVFVGAPMVLFLIIGFIAYAPGLIKGERLGGGQLPPAELGLGQPPRPPAADTPAS